MRVAGAQNSEKEVTVGARGLRRPSFRRRNGAGLLGAEFRKAEQGGDQRTSPRGP